MKQLPWTRRCFIVFLSLAGAIGIHYCVNAPNSLSYSNSIFSLILCLVWGFILKKVTGSAIWDRILTMLRECFLLGFFFFGSLACGVQLDNSGNVNFADWKIWLAVIVCAMAAAPLLGWCICRLDDLQWSDNGILREKGKISPGKYFLLVFVVLLLAYLVTLFAVWPGFFCYDAEATVYMVFTEKYSTLCPRLHVILLGWCLRGGYFFTKSYNAGIAAYLLLQIIVLSCIFSYMMTFLYKIGAHPFLRKLGILFLAFFPTVSMFVCCSTKDSFFSGGVTLLTTLLAECAYDEKVFWQSKHKRVLFVFASLLICFFRNNGPYAYVPFVILLLLRYRKYLWKCLSTVGIVLGIFVLATVLMDKAFSFTKGPIAEKYCVPMQQLARVYTERKEELTKAEKDVLYDLIPEVILDRYTPKLADSVKINFLGDNFKKEPWRYISLWLKLGFRYPSIYMNSFLENTYGYWYPDTVLDGYRDIWITSRQYKDSCYFQFVMERPGERKSLIPWLERFYEKVSLEIYQQKLPVVSMLFSVGFWHWFYLVLALFMILSKNKGQLLILAPIGLLYMTVLLGPIALVRYVLYFFFCAPLAMALLFQGRTFTK